MANVDQNESQPLNDLKVYMKCSEKFFTFDKRHRAYRFPKGILRDLLLTLGNYGVRKDEIEIKDGNHDSVYYPLGLKVNKKYKLRDY